MRGQGGEIVLGYVWRRGAEKIRSSMLGMELPGQKKRGRPKKRFNDVVREDMLVVCVKEEDAAHRKRWRQLIPCGDP